MEGKLDKIHDELSEIRKELAENTKNIAVYNAHLQEHMRRTALIEQRLDSLPNRALTILSIISGIVVVGKALLT